MKRLNLLLALGILLSGCAMVQEENDNSVSVENDNIGVKEENKEEKNGVLNHTDMNYWIEELEVPEELRCENYDFSCALQDNHASSDHINFQILNKEKSRLYPTENLYRYDLKTQQVELIKVYHDKDIRVWDSLTDEKGNLYEFVLFFEGDMEYGEVLYNGEPIIRTVPQLTFNIRRFERLGEEIYLLAESIVDETSTKWLVLHLNDGKAEVLDEVVQDRARENSEYPSVIVPNIQLNSSSWVSYATKKAGRYYIHSFNQNENIEFEVPELPHNIINLKDYILVDVLINEEDPDNVENKLYSYEIKTKELKEIGDEEIGVTIQVSDNEFYAVNNDERIKLYYYDGKELKSKEIEEITGDALAQRIVRIDDETDFVKIVDKNDIVSFYLIHWQK